MGEFTSDISDMMSDVLAALGRTIIYYKRSPNATIDTNTMARSYPSTAYPSVPAMRSTGRSQDVGRGAITEFVYTIRKVDLGATVIPDRNDQIEDTILSETYFLSVTNVETTADDLAWDITARVKRNEN